MYAQGYNATGGDVSEELTTLLRNVASANRAIREPRPILNVAMIGIGIGAIWYAATRTPKGRTR